MQVVLHPKVHADVDAIMDYYERAANQELADDFYVELQHFISYAAEHPRSFPIRQRDLRRAVVRCASKAHHSSIMDTLISDSRFSMLSEQGSKWMVKAHEEVEMIPTVNGSTIHLAISNTAGANWHGELCYAPFPVAAGSKLAVSFSARARRPFTFSVWLGQSKPPHQSLVAPENHFGEQMMTSDWQTYTHEWHPVLSEQAARLNFVLGQIDNHIELQDIALTAAV